MSGRRQPGDVKAKIFLPKCDQNYKYVGKLLQKADFFAVAHCTFSTVAMRQWKDLGKENIEIAQEISMNALLYFINVADEIVRNEPRIKIANKTDIKQACDHGELSPCNTMATFSRKSLHALKCTSVCKGNSLCIERLIG